MNNCSIDGSDCGSKLCPETQECSNVIDDLTCLERDASEPCELCKERSNQE